MGAGSMLLASKVVPAGTALSTLRPQRRRPVAERGSSRERLARGRVERCHRPTVARQDESTAEQLRGGDDVAVCDAPAAFASGAQRDGLHLALDQHVRQTCRAQDRDERRAGSVAPANATPKNGTGAKIASAVAFPVASNAGSGAA